MTLPCPRLHHDSGRAAAASFPSRRLDALPRVPPGSEVPGGTVKAGADVRTAARFRLSEKRRFADGTLRPSAPSARYHP